MRASIARAIRVRKFLTELVSTHKLIPFPQLAYLSNVDCVCDERADFRAARRSPVQCDIVDVCAD